MNNGFVFLGIHTQQYETKIMKHKVEARKMEVYTIVMPMGKKKK